MLLNATFHRDTVLSCVFIFIRRIESRSSLLSSVGYKPNVNGDLIILRCSGM